MFGGRAERVYRDSIAQLAGAGHAVSLESYRRGWFSSEATVSVAVGGHGAITLVQRVHHGPLGFYNGWHVAFPVAAVVDTNPPPKLQGVMDKIFGEAPIVMSAVVVVVSMPPAPVEVTVTSIGQVEVEGDRPPPPPPPELDRLAAPVDDTAGGGAGEGRGREEEEEGTRKQGSFTC